MKTPELTSADFKTYLEKPPIFGEGVYEHLGNYAYRAFVADHASLQTTGVWHGFSVISRLVHYAADLYPDHAEEQREEPDAEDLRAILLNSVQTPLRFTGMSNARNRVIEQYFRVKSRSQYSHSNFRGIEDLYRFEPNTALGTIFIADDDEFARASHAAEKEAPRALEGGARCPMAEITRDVVWPAMVNIAADTSEAFERSFELSPFVTV